jgi:Proteasome-substrate-size regulator, mid region/Domain of unknown function (DUF3437)
MNPPSSRATGGSLPHPHAFHLNLPPHFMDPTDGIPMVTKFAARKAQQLVDLVFTIQLNEKMFEYVDDVTPQEGGNDGTTDAMEDEDNMDLEGDSVDDSNDREAPIPFADDSPTSNALLLIAKRCSRIVSLISALEDLKFSGITQPVLMDIVLHLLRLVTATLSYETASDGSKMPKLHFENVGVVLTFPEGDVVSNGGTSPSSKDASGSIDYEVSPTPVDLANELQCDFALPTPTRESLFLALINLLSNKGPLRSVSNASIYPPSSATNRSLLILHWQPLLRMMLRTAPYLDEHLMGHPVKDSNSRTNSIVKRMVQLIRDARHFFEQGVRPPGFELDTTDQTAAALWSMVKDDVLFHSHTHACYRGTILLYLFHPTRCSQEFYLSVLPHWWDAWTNIDRCPEYDFLWLALLCRARKYVQDYDWTRMRKRILTLCQFWLQLPIGGTSMDPSFPRASNPRTRSCPARLKIFTGSGSSYDEGIDFVAKVAKILVAGLGTGKLMERSNRPAVSEGTNDMLLFLSYVTPYFNPSNLGQWTFTLGAFLHYFSYELCCRLGAAAGNAALKQSHPDVLDASLKVQLGSHQSEIPPHEVVLLLDALLPLCQQTLYSKNGHVGRAGEAAMLYLVQIDPTHTTPAFLDFACRALDISAVNLSHQAPAALSALTRLIQPALRSDPAILLARLPEILRLTLAGIDSNDQNKTIRTLIFYRSLLSWLPVGIPRDIMVNTRSSATLGGSSSVYHGTLREGKDLYKILLQFNKSSEYSAALDALPTTSLLKQGGSDDVVTPELETLLMEEASSSLSDWALEFFDRVFGLLRASGEREKSSKRASGVASRHSSADVQHARNFSRVLKETLIQTFAVMDHDTHQLAIRTVRNFLEEETLPSASKDASILCQAVAASRSSDSENPGLDALITLLTDDLLHHSTKTVIYRLRCLAGAVRSACNGVLKHRSTLSSAIAFALSSDNRHLFKTGCKLLRHCLATLVESYPLPFDMCPRSSIPSSAAGLGKSAELFDDNVRWHTPCRESIEFAFDLIQEHVVRRLNLLSRAVVAGTSCSFLNTLDVSCLRRFLRVIRYALRGGASILLDANVDPDFGDTSVPYETACSRLIYQTDVDIRMSLLTVRARICAFVVALSSIISAETLYPKGLDSLDIADPSRKVLPLISSDPKICKETIDISLLLLTRRGTAFRSQEASTIWKAQKQLASDFMLTSQVDQISEVLQSAGLYLEAQTALYKDGEDGGKTIPRRLLVARVQLFHDSLHRSGSFEIPRRIRILERNNRVLRNRLFNVKKSNLSEMLTSLEAMLSLSNFNPLDGYEGIIDGLFALCCHSNSQVRASALSVIDYSMSRFGWMVAARVPRLLLALDLDDEGINGEFGIPSFCALLENSNQQGKRKNLADAGMGVCSILALSRSMKHVLQSTKLRHQFAKTICNADKLIAFLPAEEAEKLVHYVQAVFSQFRSKIFNQRRLLKSEEEHHNSTLRLCLSILSEKKADNVLLGGEVPVDNGSVAHWRKMLLSCWFILSFVDVDDLSNKENDISIQTWSTCFRILETERGQPLQRVGLGLFGRLVQFCRIGGFHTQLLREQMMSKSFCTSLGEALVYDHKEDSSVGGGHDAQWATGVEDIFRDSARNVAPRTLFPFHRTSQALGAFKSSHCQLTEMFLSVLDEEASSTAISNLLSFAKDLINAPPSEDMRNQQVAAAEIFGGVCGSFRKRDENELLIWYESLLPHLDEAMVKIPFALAGAYFDAIRYALQFSPSSHFLSLTEWIIEKILVSLWQPVSENKLDDDLRGIGEGVTVVSTSGEGFTAQSKWLYLFNAILIEMDNSSVMLSRTGFWYKLFLLPQSPRFLTNGSFDDDRLEKFWQLVFDKLLPGLLSALGHPFDSCRDHISRCLFRICYCYRKIDRRRTTDESQNDIMDPCILIVDKLAMLDYDVDMSFVERCNALGTARRFISYSVQLGEARFEVSRFVIPLLRLAFEAINPTVEDEISKGKGNNLDEVASKRSLEAELVKSYRFTLAEISVTSAITYGDESDIAKVLDAVEIACLHEKWQVRHAAVHFFRCFLGVHKFLLLSNLSTRAMLIATRSLSDERREVNSAGMAALTGILASSPVEYVTSMMFFYIQMANDSISRRPSTYVHAQNQKTSVFFLCAAILSQPYETPSYIPPALAAISKHSFERNAPLGVRDAVKRCCAEYKKNHMSDNWELHRSAFSQEQLEALEDVISTPHYYA